MGLSKKWSDWLVLPAVYVTSFFILLPVAFLIEVLTVPENSQWSDLKGKVCEGLIKDLEGSLPAYRDAEHWVPLYAVRGVVVHLRWV